MGLINTKEVPIDESGAKGETDPIVSMDEINETNEIDFTEPDSGLPDFDMIGSYYTQETAPDMEIVDTIQVPIIIDANCGPDPYMCCKHMVTYIDNDGVTKSTLLKGNAIICILDKFDMLKTGEDYMKYEHFIQQSTDQYTKELLEQYKKQLGFTIRLREDTDDIYAMKRGGSTSQLYTFCQRVNRVFTENSLHYHKIKYDKTTKMYVLAIGPTVHSHYIKSFFILDDDKKIINKTDVESAELYLDNALLMRWYGSAMFKDEQFSLLNMIPIFTKENEKKNLSIKIKTMEGVKLSDVYLETVYEKAIETKNPSEVAHRNIIYETLYSGPVQYNVELKTNGYYSELRFCVIDKRDSTKIDPISSIVDTLTITNKINRLPTVLFSQKDPTICTINFGHGVNDDGVNDQGLKANDHITLGLELNRNSSDYQLEVYGLKHVIHTTYNY